MKFLILNQTKYKICNISSFVGTHTRQLLNMADLSHFWVYHLNPRKRNFVFQPQNSTSFNVSMVMNNFIKGFKTNNLYLNKILRRDFKYREILEYMRNKWICLTSEISKRNNNMYFETSTTNI